MDNIRFLLIMAMLMISYMLWEQWQIDYGPKPQAIISDKPVVSGSSSAEQAAVQPLQNKGQQNSALSTAAVNENIITVKTDVFAGEIDTTGGTLRKLDLLKYPHEKENTVVNKAYALIGLNAPEKNLSPIRLFDNSPENLFLAQSGLVAGDNSAAAPDHHAVFNAERNAYEMQDGQDQLSIPLTWTDAQGLQVTKTFTFKRGSYLVAVEQKVHNQSAKPWSGRQYDQLLRIEHNDKSNSNNFIRTFSGGVVYTDKENLKKSNSTPWAII